MKRPELPGLLEQELYVLISRCWNKGEFNFPALNSYKSRVEELGKVYNVYHHKLIVKAWTDAHELFMQDQRAGVI